MAIISWTPDRIEFLRQLASEGKSASVIAKFMAERFNIDFTRNSIVGKCKREEIKLNYRNGASGKSLVEKIERAKKEKEEFQRKEDEKRAKRALEVLNEKFWAREEGKKIGAMFPNPEAIGMRFMELGFRNCRYPQGDVVDGTLYFCGAPVIKDGGSYCGYCYQITHTHSNRRD